MIKLTPSPKHIAVLYYIHNSHANARNNIVIISIKIFPPSHKTWGEWPHASVMPSSLCLLLVALSVVHVLALYAEVSFGMLKPQDEYFQFPGDIGVTSLASPSCTSSISENSC